MVFLILFAAYVFPFKAQGATQSTEASVSYRTYVQSYGFTAYKKNGETSGTLGESKRLEAIQIKVSSKLYSGGITYRTYCQSYGWRWWSENGSINGTQGQSKRLEAIQIKLTGELAEQYDVYYRVYSQTYGWLSWAKNGASAGTSGLSK